MANLNSYLSSISNNFLFTFRKFSIYAHILKKSKMKVKMFIYFSIQRLFHHQMFLQNNHS